MGTAHHCPAGREEPRGACLENGGLECVCACYREGSLPGEWWIGVCVCMLQGGEPAWRMVECVCVHATVCLSNA